MNAVTRSKKGKNSRRKQPQQEEAVGKYASDAWSLAKRTAYGLNEIRKLINIETKFFDTIITSTTQSTTGSITSLSQMGQGLNSTSRVGDSIRIQHIEVRGRVTISTAAVTSLVRFMIVRDLDGYGTVPAVTDVLETAVAVSAPLAPYKFNKRQRFSILYDEIFALAGGATADGSSTQVFTFSSAHQGHILYLGTGAVSASDGKGTIYYLAVSDEATNTPTVALTSRILFTDD